MKKNGKFIIYVIGMVFLIYGGIECFLNYTLNHPEKSPENWRQDLIDYYTKDDQVIIQQEPEMAQYDSSLFYTLRPGSFTFKNRGFSTPYQVNSLGLRDDEASLDYPKIIMLGDSYGMGWGVDQEKSYAELVEKSLNSKVLNAGISSYGTPREIKLLDRIDTDSLEYLIIQFCPNDLAEIQSYLENNKQLAISSESVYDSICALVRKKSKYYPFKHSIQLLPQLLKNNSEVPEPKKQPSKSNPVEFDLHRGFLNLIRDSNKIPPRTKVIAFMLGELGHSNAFMLSSERKLSMEIFTSLYDQMVFLDFSEVLDSSHYFILDVHTNEKGHQLIADSLIQRIQALERDTTMTIKTWKNKKGSIMIQSEQRKGIKDGLTTYYWENGTVSQTNNYEKGQKKGWEIRYDSSGKEIGRVLYRSGVAQR